MPSRAMHTMIPAKRTARPRGVDRVDDGGLTSPPGNQTLSVSGHDEEGVVDADAQADEEHQLGRELGHLDDVAQHADQADGGAQGEEGGDDGEDGGEERAEDERAARSSASRTPSPVLLKDCLLACSASGPVTATFSPSAEVLVTVSTNVFASLFEMLLVCLSKLTWKNPTVWLALTLDVLTRFPCGVVGRRDGGHVGQRLDLVDHGVDARPDGRVGDLGTARGGEDDLLGVAGLVRARPTSEQREGVETTACWGG